MIAASPVFAASYSGLFKMFMDALDPNAITGMPVIIAATAGTPRHSMMLEYAMRPLLSYLRADVMSTAVFAATDDFGGEEGLERRIERAASKLADEIVRVSGAVERLGPSSQVKRSSGNDVAADVPDFLNLLSGHDGN